MLGLPLAGTQIHSLAGPEQFRNYLNTVSKVYTLLQVIPISVFGSVLWLVSRSIQKGRVRTSPDLIIVVWCLLPIVLTDFSMDTCRATLYDTAHAGSFYCYGSRF